MALRLPSSLTTRHLRIITFGSDLSDQPRFATISPWRSLLEIETMDEDHDDDLPLICPVTGAPCTTEQDEFCEDYGCARKAGIDVERDLIA